MLFGKKYFTKVIAITAALVAVALNSNQANAYDTDTHFYATYAMARFAGINHEAASIIATSAQWPDETEFLGSPMITELVVGTKMRRLFHFACNVNTAEKNNISVVNVNIGVLGKVVKNDESRCVTEEDSKYTRMFLYEGLKEGSLIKAASTFHILEDSFAHEGTNALEGHALFWHWPDRPFNPNGSQDKYERMVLAVMKAMVLVRKALPESYLDKNYTDLSTSTTPNYLRTAADLHHDYLTHPEIAKLYKYDVLKSAQYVSFALAYLINQSQKTDLKSEYWLINPNIDALSILKADPDFRKVIASEKFDARYVLKLAVMKLAQFEKINRIQILNKYMGLVTVDPLKDTTAAVAKIESRIEDLVVRVQTLIKDGYTGHQDEIAQLEKQISELRNAHTFIASQKIGPELASVIAGMGEEGVITAVVSKIAKGYIPKVLDSTNLTELEDDGPIRNKEMDIRINNVRAAIKNLFNTNIKFVENDKKWSYPKLRDSVQKIPELTAEEKAQGVQQVTFNYKQIDEWVQMAIRFFMPDASNVIWGTGNIELGPLPQILIAKTNMEKLAALKLDTKVMKAVWNLDIIEKDLRDTHRLPETRQEELLQNADKFDAALASGEFKKLIPRK